MDVSVLGSSFLSPSTVSGLLELSPTTDGALLGSSHSWSLVFTGWPLVLDSSETFETVFARRLGEMAIFSLLAKFATARFGGREVDAPDEDGPG